MHAMTILVSPGIVPCAMWGFPCEKLPKFKQKVSAGFANFLVLVAGERGRERVRLRQRPRARRSVFRTEGMMALRWRVSSQEIMTAWTSV